MQPDAEPGIACLRAEEQELLSVVQLLSPGQKKAIAQYLSDYAKQEPQKGETQNADLSKQNA